jgi:hypothetical protein
VPKTVLRPLFLLLFSMWLSSLASAQSIQLRWIPPTTPGVVGYNVYIAQTAAGPISATPIDVGLPATDAGGVASAIVNGNRAVPLSIEMTSYDAQRRESVRSNRVSLVPSGESLGDALFSSDFQTLAVGANPEGFLDLGGNFMVAEYSGGNRAFAAPSTTGTLSTRYLAHGSGFWPPYEVSGRMFVPSGARVAGLALRAKTADLSQTFLFGGDSRGVFALDQRGNPPLRCASSSSTGVSVVGNVTYRFRVRFTKPSGRGRLRAKAWRDTDAEPVSWQADCWTDVALTADNGPFAFYREGTGAVYWDNISVRPVLGTFDPIP